MRRGSDVLDMRNRSGIALLGLAVVVAAAGVEAAHASPAPSAAGHRTAPAVTECVLPAIPGAGHAVSEHQSRPRHHHTHAAGNLAVTIPAAVFIRSEGHQLVVTTNTGQSPQPTDTFYYLATGHASIASAGIRRQVIVACAQ